MKEWKGNDFGNSTLREDNKKPNNFSESQQIWVSKMFVSLRKKDK